MSSIVEEKSFIPQISGLRAFSVLVVILYHIDERLMPSGYLGVDVFFVISGYVITKSIFSNINKENSFSLVTFYVRRIVRIYPALLVCIFITIIFLSLFGDYVYFESYLVSSLYAVVGLSNIHFFKLGDDYFNQHLVNPLLHTWSLGVEEQFYFVYPVLIFLFFSLFKKKDKLTVISYISFILCMITFTTYLSDSIFSNYYLPTSRFWELSLGCLAFTIVRLPTDRAKFIPYISIFSLFIIVFLDPILLEKEFTVIICFSTFFLIRSFNKKNFRFLKYKPFIFLGSISYSTYLYHLPVIYFADLYVTESYFLILSLLFSYGLSILSYLYVEETFSQSRKTRVYCRKLILGIPFIASLIVITSLIHGLGETRDFVRQFVNKTTQKLESFNIVKNDKLRGYRYSSSYMFNDVDYQECHQKGFDVQYYLNTCYKKQKSSSLVYVFGDSFAQQYLPMIDNSSMNFDIISTSWNGSTFFPMLFSEDKDILDFSQRLLVEITQEKKYEKKYLIIGAAYYNYFDSGKRNDKYPAYHHNSLGQYYAELEDIMVEYISNLPDDFEVILLTSPPRPTLTVGQCLFRSQLSGQDPMLKKCSYAKIRDLEELTFLGNVAQKTISSIFDPYDFFCPDYICSFVNEKNEVITHDIRHITIEASISTVPYFDNWLQNNKYFDR